MTLTFFVFKSQDLGENKLGHKGARIVGHMLLVNQTLQRLALDGMYNVLAGLVYKVQQRKKSSGVIIHGLRRNTVISY